MARRRKKGGRRKPKPSVIMLVAIGAGIYGMFKHVQGGGSGTDKAGRAVEAIIGINPFTGNPKFQWQKMFFTLPVVGGAVAKKVIGFTGASRYFRGLPFTA
jgi:hypothetical protein